jgi:D-3-phosphoglycerate dehydrogenase
MSMNHILITDDLSPQAVERLEAAGDADFDVVSRPTPEELREIIRSYDAIIIRSSVRVDADLVAAASQLKVIGRAGMGLDNVDIDAASLRGVIVMNTPGANTVATAEHTVAMLLALCRNVPQADASMRRGEWTRSQFTGVQLYRKTLGIVGLGRIGAQVARRIRAFGMSIIAFDPYISDEVARELNVTLVDLDELLALGWLTALEAG